MSRRVQAPPELKAAQSWLSNVILSGASDAPEHVATGRSILRGPSADDVATRLGAYVGGYPSRIHAALEEAYPAVGNLLGAAAFMEMAERYGPTAPSGEFSLDKAAAGFPEFLRSDDASQRLPFLVELAELERFLQEAFHAEAGEPADASVAAEWTPDQWGTVRIGFQPYVGAFISDWPLRDLWDTRDVERTEIDLQIEGRPQAVLVFREGFRVRCETVATAEAEAVRALSAGATLGRVIAALAEAGESPDAVAGWFASWAGRGLIASLSTD